MCLKRCPMVCVNSVKILVNGRLRRSSHVKLDVVVSQRLSFGSICQPMKTLLFFSRMTQWPQNSLSWHDKNPLSLKRTEGAWTCWPLCHEVIPQPATIPSLSVSRMISCLMSYHADTQGCNTFERVDKCCRTIAFSKIIWRTGHSKTKSVGAT